MEACSKAKFQRYGSRKVMFLLDLVRGKSVKASQGIVPFSGLRCCDLVQKTINSAAANLGVKTGNRTPDLAKIYIKEAYANIGPMKHLKRIQPGPQGRAMPYKKSVCHLTVIVSDEKKGAKTPAEGGLK
ncbi:MAG: 50S ribosomal protein L22 [Elusimicrobiota bacterium]|jgi:large subunit ribosomal protein L22|nr:50S ribosomal protein L22 [Elusimicrobiota bacterium]